MTLQQLKYFLKIVETGSINLAARLMYVSQPSISKAVSELESEMGISIFKRTSKGVILSDEGTKFLSYARQIMEQVELLEGQYKKGVSIKKVFSVSSQHYAFVVNAFVELVKEMDSDKYEFSLRECRTADIIEDVRTSRSELGVLYLSDFNREIIKNIINRSELEFCELFEAVPHVFVSRSNPLANKSQVTLDELKYYPRLTFEQGLQNSFYFAEEPHITAESYKNITVSDRATLFNLLLGLNGYTVSSGILSSDLNGTNIVSVPLVSDEKMKVGYICLKDHSLSQIAENYLTKLKNYIDRYKFDATKA